MPSRTTPLHEKSPICRATELLKTRMPPVGTLRPSYISRRGSVQKLSQTRRSPRCASHDSLALFSCPARSNFRCHYLGSFLSPKSEADGHPYTWTPFRISQPGALFCRNNSYSNSPCISPPVGRALTGFRSKSWSKSDGRFILVACRQSRISDRSYRSCRSQCVLNRACSCPRRGGGQFSLSFGPDPFLAGSKRSSRCTDLIFKNYK